MTMGSAVTPSCLRLRIAGIVRRFMGAGVGLARLVDVFSRRPQVQERLTTQIADSLLDILGAQGVIVVIEAEHLCMTMRGVRKPGAKTITSAIRGSMHKPATHAEAMSLIMHGTR